MSDDEFVQKTAHLKEVKQIMLQGYLDGKLLGPIEVMTAVQHLQPPDGWHNLDIVYIGSFFFDMFNAKACYIPGAKALAEQHGLTLQY